MRSLLSLAAASLVMFGAKGYAQEKLATTKAMYMVTGLH